VAEPVRSMYVAMDHDCSKTSTVHDSIEAPKRSCRCRYAIYQINLSCLVPSSVYVLFCCTSVFLVRRSICYSSRVHYVHVHVQGGKHQE
jgi:hypothetical protein